MMNPDKKSFRGVFPVIQTPYGDDGSIEYDVLNEEIDWVFRHGVDGLTIALASEILRLTDAERCELGARTVEICNGRGPVVVSVGGESLAQVQHFARVAEDSGASAVMAIPPLSVRCSESELHKYFECILREVSVPLVIQDASAYLGVPLSIHFQCEISKEFGDRILFKPEADPVGPVIAALQNTESKNTGIFEGNGGLDLVNNFKQGCTGSMPACDIPWAIVPLWRNLEVGNFEAAEKIQKPLTSLVSVMCSCLDAFIVTEKHLLVRQGIFRNKEIRRPMEYIPDPLCLKELDRCFDRLSVAVAGVIDS
jgi:4-hydroxy-tetrahydrodipicolinate synthase